MQRVGAVCVIVVSKAGFAWAGQTSNSKIRSARGGAHVDAWPCSCHQDGAGSFRAPPKKRTQGAEKCKPHVGSMHHAGQSRTPHSTSNLNPSTATQPTVWNLHDHVCHQSHRRNRRHRPRRPDPLRFHEPALRRRQRRGRGRQAHQRQRRQGALLLQCGCRPLLGACALGGHAVDRVNCKVFGGQRERRCVRVDNGCFVTGHDLQSER
jgi:hypothetical protein